MSRINITASYEAYIFEQKPASSAKSSMDRLFEKGQAGIWLLNSPIRKGELKLNQFQAQDAKEFALKLLEIRKPRVLL
jgi:hypothetical protein